MADIIQAIENARQYDPELDEDLLISICRSLGPVVYNRGTSYVSCSDSMDLDLIKNSFIRKQLGVDKDDASIEQDIQGICSVMSGTHTKLRVVFYYLLVRMYRKEALF